ncbi:MAG: translation initiation factor IF-1 [Akkermansiaceae bacterium]|jgi:translation initiation factor IF-1|nr:translation initiation factor IF-1 [Akkermansiaceae bacterium]
MSEAAIETTGIILERKGEILYRVELMNGKVVLGHLSKPLTDAKAELADGTSVLLEMTPYDFDHARILRECPR